MTRTWLYAPGDQPAKLAKAVASGADAVILDLEDAVAPDQKAAARHSVAEFLSGMGDSTGPQLWLRVNAVSVAEDLAGAAHPALTGICLPKVDTPAEVAAMADQLAELDRSQRDGRPPLGLMLMIETARGVLDCDAIAGASPRVTVLQLGEQDLSADLRLPKGSVEISPSLAAARTAVVFVSAAHRLEAPVGPVSTVIHDADALETESRTLRSTGFGGRAVIHPAQLVPVATAFTSSPDELDWAKRVVEADERARSEGRGVVVVDGQMVDAPVVAQARAILSNG